MDIDIYFRFIGPFVFLVFAGGFGFIHMVKTNYNALIFACSYVVGAVAFTLDVIFETSANVFIESAIALLYAITAALLTAGFHNYYRGKVPWYLLSVIVVIHIVIYSTLLVSGTPWIGSFSANFGCGIIFTIGLLAFRGQLRRNIDGFLFGIHLVSCLTCFLRPLIIAALADGPLTPANYNEALFAVSLHFIVATAAIVTAMVLLALLSMDQVENLRESSMTDELTRIPNRRGFYKKAEAMLAKKIKQPVNMIVSDIDHFKAVNDTHGHIVGDRVITAFGQLLAKAAKPNHLPGRVGGEEFALLVTGLSLYETIEFAEKLRRTFEALLPVEASPDLNCTASFGVAKIMPETPILTAYSLADKALYLAKASGRNRVCSELDVKISTMQEHARDTRDTSFTLDATSKRA